MDEIKELIKLSGSVTVGETPVIRIRSNSCRTVKWRLRAPFCYEQDKLVIAFRLRMNHHVSHPVARHANGVGHGFTPTIPLTSSEQNRSPSLSDPSLRAGAR